MSTTYGDLQAQVLRQTKEDERHLWPDATVRGCILDAIRELGVTHPDAMMNKHGRVRATPNEWAEAPETENLPVDDYYIPALVALSVAKLHLREGADAKDESIGSYWMRRYAELSGG